MIKMTLQKLKMYKQILSSCNSTALETLGLKRQFYFEFCS